MTRRSSKSTSTSTSNLTPNPSSMPHAGFATNAAVDGKTTSNSDVLLRKHRLLRRASMPMLARKYRTTRWRSSSRGSGAAVAPHSNQSSPSGSASGAEITPKTFTREELINFWRDLPMAGKRPLLRIHRDVFLTALDQFLVRHNLCCECHDNVIAEWEDHEHRRAGSRSLLDVFSVFPPFLDDEEDGDDEDDDEDEEDEDEDDRFEDSEDSDDMLEGEAVLMHDEEVVFKYELDREEFRRARTSGLLSDEYLAALEIGKRQEDELLRLIQKEERYIIIREDHPEFIMDLIRCGDEFSYVEPFRSGLDDDSEGEDDDENDDGECPGANTSHLAQEYLLEVLAIKFREQLENAYQAALQHSLAVQAELLRDEIADLQQSQKPSSSQKKKKKDRQKKKKQKKKEAAAPLPLTRKGTTSSMTDSTKTNSSSESSSVSRNTASRPSKGAPELQATSPPSTSQALSSPKSSVKSSSIRSKEVMSNEPCKDLDESPTDNDDVDREVEEFRLLLEFHAQSTPRQKPKLVLPPGAFRAV